MSVFPDFMIRAACITWPTTWSPGAGPDVGKELPIPDAGPLLTPFSPDLIGPSSVDLRVGTSFASPTPFDAWMTRNGVRHTRIGSDVTRIDETNIPAIHRKGDYGIEVDLMPGAVLACVSAEYARIPPNAVGELYVKSSRAREWVDHSNASLIHPGFHGTITYEIRNDGPKTYVVSSGMRLVHLKLTRMAACPEKPYFAQDAAKYRQQINQLHSLDPERKG